MSDRTTALAAQDLDESDLEANRAGRVSEKQLARQAAVQKFGSGYANMFALGMFLGGAGIGGFNLLRGGTAGFAIFMTLLGAAGAAIPLAVYYGTRFPSPAKIGACAVTKLERADVGVFLPAPFRGVYAISLDHKRYSGLAYTLTAAMLGKHVTAYVVEPYRIVVALEPVD